MKIRKPKFASLFIVPATLLALASSPHATVIDFESLEHVDALQTALPGTGKFYTESGYDFTSSAPIFNFATWGTLHPNYLGSTALWNGDGTGVTGITTLTRSDNGAFDLLSIDVGELNVTGPGIATVVFEAAFEGGGTTSQSFTTDGVRSTGSGFETVSFSGFTDIVSVSWLQVSPFIQFDNVTVADDASSVPEPTALAILGLGLAGFSAMRRRRAS